MAVITKKSSKFQLLLLVIVTTFTLLVLRLRANTDYVSTFNNAKRKSEIDPLKYILVWTNPARDPIMNLETERKAFIRRKCVFNNCYVSTDRNFLDIDAFDAVIFHSSDVKIKDLPKSRAPHQKYVYASMESAHIYPICNQRFNNFYNLTWTYKLKSDVEYSYISIWNKNGEVIGPKEIMHWKPIEEMDPVNDTLRMKLSSKKYAVAWFVSNCNTPSKREKLVKLINRELRKYDLVLDIYGSCGNKKCPRNVTKHCLKKLESDYYFYLSFENSFSEDYVTEKLLSALQNYAVPIVYGGANYTRFMPDGIYLDANKMGPAELAAKIAELIKDKEQYYKYFKWHNHYSYHDVIDSPITDPYCKLCSMLNNYNEHFRTPHTYPDIKKWWNFMNC